MYHQSQRYLASAPKTEMFSFRVPFRSRSSSATFKMSFGLKKVTNLTGIPVAENAKQRLILLYNKILKELAKMPESYTYRRATEEVIKHRSSIATAETDIATIEKKINCGQIEELLIQAKNELELSRKFLVWKPWEPLETSIPKNQWKWPIH